MSDFGPETARRCPKCHDRFSVDDGPACGCFDDEQEQPLSDADSLKECLIGITRTFVDHPFERVKRG